MIEVRDSERIAELEYRVEVLEAFVGEIEKRLKLKRKPVPPYVPPVRALRAGAPAGPVRDERHREDFRGSAPTSA